MENELEAAVWPQWFDQGAAIRDFESTPQPTRKDESWRFANIGALDLSEFVQAPSVSNEGRLIVASRGLEKSAGKMVFGNNALLHEDSSRLPEGVIFCPLEVAAREHEALFKKYFMAQPVELGCSAGYRGLAPAGNFSLG